jgi:putative flippase GtrA
MPERLLGQFGRFALAGALGLAVDVAVLYGAMALGADWVLGRLLSFVAAASFTWVANRRYAFAATASPLREWARYLAGMAGGLLVNFLVYAMVHALLPPAWWAPGLAAACGSAAGLLVNFASAKFLVFTS